MHVQTHILSGWVFGNLLPLRPRERLLCMIAASAPDIDGLGILYSEELYWDLHHKLGHCLLFGVALAIALVPFHLHLLMDYYGSGPNWAIYYYWPFSLHEWESEHAWPLFSWQNITAFAALFAWTIWIGWRHRRTPLELLMPSLDRKLTCRAEQTALAPAPAPAPAAASAVD